MSSPSPSWPAASPGRRRTLDPKLDVVFKMLFGDPRHQRLLVSLLEAVMQPATPITEVTVLNPGLPKDLAGDKDVELDVRVREGSGRQYDVEMQRCSTGRGCTGRSSGWGSGTRSCSPAR